jgi:hypothetical protein
MSRRMLFVVAVSAVAGLAIALLLGEDRRPTRPAGVAAPDAAPSDNPAEDMAKALRKAIEGHKAN